MGGGGGGTECQRTTGAQKRCNERARTEGGEVERLASVPGKSRDGVEKERSGGEGEGGERL